MVAGINDIVTFYLVTHVCLSSGILTAKLSQNSQASRSLQSPPRIYLPTETTKLPKLSVHASFHDASADVKSSGTRVEAERSRIIHLHSKPPSNEFNLPTKDRKIKSFSNPSPPQESLQRDKLVAATRSSEASRPSTQQPRAAVEYHPHVPRRSSYQVVEDLDEYLTDDLNHAGLPHRGKPHTTYPQRDSTQDITTSIKALDHFLSGVLNADGYNSSLHPPTNPVLALVLSRYGRYVPGARNPRVYSYMAVNNIHNYKPFGSYKIECDEEPDQVVR